VSAGDWSAFVHGFAINIALIMTLGAQNIFILRQSLSRRHVTTTASVCLVVDIGLIAMGVVGLGGLIATRPWISSAGTWGGAVFLLVYALGTLRMALRPQAVPVSAAPAGQRRRICVAGKALAVSALNPQAYLDSVIVMGGLAASLAPTHRVGLCLGAISASAIWFFGFGYGARFAAPWFRQAATWRALSVISAGCLLWIAAGLVWHEMTSETIVAIR
jgi:L-lysine exporter family protein LysE/ArgO